MKRGPLSRQFQLGLGQALQLGPSPLTKSVGKAAPTRGTAPNVSMARIYEAAQCLRKDDASGLT